VTAFFNNSVKVVVRVLNEFFDCFLVGKYTVLLVVLKNTEVGLTWHQKSLLYNMNQAETEEVKWNVHEVWCIEGHLSDNVVTNNF